MENPDTNLLNVEEKQRKYSVEAFTPDPDEIEKITFPPSTELIPDEYEHEDNAKGQVVIFQSVFDKHNVEVLREALTDQGYMVKDKDVFLMNKTDVVMDQLSTLGKQDYSDKTCLIMIFMGNHTKQDQFLPDDEKVLRSISMRDVWAPFTSNKCNSLRHKPKIFIFQASPEPKVEVDYSPRFLTPQSMEIERAYDIPAEADMLLIYKRNEDTKNRNDFMMKLCNNFHDYGCKDDMIGLVTHTEHPEGERRPIVISTLTRKFYISPSSKRGHYYDLYANNEKVIRDLEDLHEKIKEIHDQNAVKWKAELRLVRTRQDFNSVFRQGVTADGSANVSRQSPTVSRSSFTSVDSKLKKKKDTKKPKIPWKF